MISANDRITLARELENPSTAPTALKTILKSEFPSFGPDFDGAIKALEMTETLYVQLAQVLLTQGVPTLLKEIVGLQVIREEANNTRDAIAAWLAVHPEYVKTTANREALEQFIDGQDWPWTVSNLEKAWKALMLAGKLEEDPQKGGLNFRLPGQRDPGRAIDGDVLPRKRVGNMSALEFANAIANSKKFRDKVNEGPAVSSPAGITDAERELRAENTKKQASKQELQRKINQMPSRTYDAWIKQPGNQALVDSLYAHA
jgi:hypothetical protein